jgi:hypothetical protein
VARAPASLQCACNVNHNGPPLDSTEMWPACLPLPRRAAAAAAASAKKRKQIPAYDEFLALQAAAQRDASTSKKARLPDGGQTPDRRRLLPSGWACFALSFSGEPLSTVTPPVDARPAGPLLSRRRTPRRPNLENWAALGGPKLPSFPENSSVSVHMVFPAGPPIRSVVQYTSVQSTTRRPIRFGCKRVPDSTDVESLRLPTVPTPSS